MIERMVGRVSDDDGGGGVMGKLRPGMMIRSRDHYFNRLLNAM